VAFLAFVHLALFLALSLSQHLFLSIASRGNEINEKGGVAYARPLTGINVGPGICAYNVWIIDICCL